MMFSRFANWLGLGRSSLVAGLHLSAEHLSMVAVKSAPLRLVAVGRELVFDAAVVHDEVRLATNLARDVATLAGQLGLEAGTPVVAAIEPRHPTLSIADPLTEMAHRCEVKSRNHDRMIEVVAQAGLQLIRLDPVPLALLRAVAGGATDRTIALRSRSRWSVVAGPLLVEAERSSSGAATLSAGPDLGSLQPVTEPPAIAIPRRLQDAVDLDLDAVAIGAALAGHGIPPLAAVHPVDDERSSNWAVQRVEARPRTNPQPPTPPAREETTT